MESADTGPFFHNHTVNDLESAVAFYGTPAFQNSGPNGATPVNISADPNDPEVLAIAAFLHVLNALENIRSSINVAERGGAMTRTADLRDSARLSLAETIDALEVLSEGALATLREPAIRSARIGRVARVALDVAQHLPGVQAIDNLLNVAVRHLRAARSALANPATRRLRSATEGAPGEPTWLGKPFDVVWAIDVLRGRTPVAPAGAEQHRSA